MNRSRLVLAAAAMAIFAPPLARGCAAVDVPADHAAQDRAYFNVLAPRLAAYTVSDPALSNEQKARRLRTLDDWALQVGATTTAKPQPAKPGDNQ